MLVDAALALRDVAREQDDDGVQIRSWQPADPVVRMVGAGIAEDLRPRGHALAELVGKRRQRGLVDAERAQPVPGERDGDPARVERLAAPDATAPRADLVQESGEPDARLLRLAGR